MVFLLGAIKGNSQEVPAVPKERRLIVLPSLFRNPETRFGLILGAVYTLKLDKTENGRPSLIKAGVGYTQNKQFISYISGQIFTAERRYQLNADLGYYNYFFPFGGVGFSTPSDYNENYYVRFPRVRLTALRRAGANIYYGPKLAYDQYTIRRTQSGGLLEQSFITGSKGGPLFQYGFQLNYDSRDNIFSAQKGWLVESSVTASDNKVLGNYTFVNYVLNVNQYLAVKENTTFAWNVCGDFFTGDPPFNAMAYLGGPFNMRGFYSGRYRDRQAISSQAEIRWRIIPWFSVVGFLSSGTVANEISGMRFDQMLYTAGTGFRLTLNEKSRMGVRVDYAYTNKGYGNFYVGVGEAF